MTEKSRLGYEEGCSKPFCPHCRPDGDEVVTEIEGTDEMELIDEPASDNDDGSRQPSPFGRNRIDSQNIPVPPPTPRDMVVIDNDDQFDKFGVCGNYSEYPDDPNPEY